MAIGSVPAHDIGKFLVVRWVSLIIMGHCAVVLGAIALAPVPT